MRKTQRLKSEILERDKNIKSLEEKIKLLRITRSVGTHDIEVNKESRQKINEYVGDRQVY